MRTFSMALIAIGLAYYSTGSASAHIGEEIYLLFEVSEADLAKIDLRDGSVDDWEEVFGEPTFVPTD
jgi:hypothetical protein